MKGSPIGGPFLFAYAKELIILGKTHDNPMTIQQYSLTFH